MSKVQTLWVCTEPDTGAFGICLESCGTRGCSWSSGSRAGQLEQAPQMCPCILPVCSECLKIPLKPGLVPSAGFEPAQSSLSCTQHHFQLGEEGFGLGFSFGCLWDTQPWLIQPQRCCGCCPKPLSELSLTGPDPALERPLGWGFAAPAQALTHRFLHLLETHLGVATLNKTLSQTKILTNVSIQKGKNCS